MTNSAARFLLSIIAMVVTPLIGYLLFYRSSDSKSLFRFEKKIVSTASADRNTRFKDIKNRDDLIKAAQEFRFKTGAELGSNRPEFAKRVLQSWTSGEKYYIVSLWQGGNRKADGVTMQAPPIDSSTRYRDAVSSLSNFGDIPVFLLMNLTAAASNVKDDSLDWIYVHPMHDYCFFSDEINAWWPKLRQGGILAGQGFLDHELNSVDPDKAGKSDLDWIRCRNESIVIITNDALPELINNFAKKKGVKSYPMTNDSPRTYSFVLIKNIA